jgi:short-subunit dehydrogenase
MKPLDYSGKHVWIIGASSGIGQVLARELTLRGAKLALSARSEDKLAALKKELGERHVICPLDVSDAQQAMDAAQKIQSQFPRLDCVVFLAAIYTPMRLEALELAQMRSIIEINLMGAFHMVHAVLPILRQQQCGQIALCGSVAGYCGLPGGQPYSATKAGIINLAESLRADMARSPIDVKLISPGFVATQMTAKNDFAMPMMIAPEKAAKAIADGLLAPHFEIHFPKRFTYLVKFLRLLPAWLYFPIIKRVV